MANAEDGKPIARPGSSDKLEDSVSGWEIYQNRDKLQTALDVQAAGFVAHGARQAAAADPEARKPNKASWKGVKANVVSPAAPAMADVASSAAASSQAPAGGALLPTEVTRGYMTKQGGMMKNWKKRWFVLEGHTLTYYADKANAESSYPTPKGSVDMRQVSAVEMSQVEHKGASINLTIPGRVHKFLNPDQSARELWFSRLTEVHRIISSAPPGTFGPVASSSSSSTPPARPAPPTTTSAGREMVSLDANIDILLARDTTANELGIGAVHVSLLDMGGQPEFWQPIGGLLRNNSVITVCGDMREILHNIRKNEPIYGDSHMQGIDELFSWLDVISSRTGDGKVIIGLSRADVVTSSKEYKLISDTIHARLRAQEHPILTDDRIVFGPNGLIFFPLDNTKGLKSDGVAAYQKAMQKCCEESSSSNQLVPLELLQLQDTVQALQVRNLVGHYCCPIRPPISLSPLLPYLAVFLSLPRFAPSFRFLVSLSP